MIFREDVAVESVTYYNTDGKKLINLFVVNVLQVEYKQSWQI
jgi:hypothetical protein